MQRCALIVTEEISKEFIGECWTYSIGVLTKLQLNPIPHRLFWITQTWGGFCPPHVTQPF